MQHAGLGCGHAGVWCPRLLGLTWQVPDPTTPLLHALPPPTPLQEPDAARTKADDKSSDPDFGVSKEEMRAAENAAAEDPAAGESTLRMPPHGMIICVLAVVRKL
jgi:hypothetical protein